MCEEYIQRLLFKRTLTLIYLKTRSSLCPGDSNPELCDNLGGQDEMRGGKKVQERENICIPMANSC